MQKRNRIAMTADVRPVLPPAAIPAFDSAKFVTVEVPRVPPTTVATASERSAFFICHFSLRMISLYEVPINVPTVSKRSTTQKVTISSRAVSSPIFMKQSKSNLKNVVEKKSLNGGSQLAFCRDANGSLPQRYAPDQYIMEAARIQRGMHPGILRYASTAMVKKPASMVITERYISGNAEPSFSLAATVLMAPKKSSPIQNGPPLSEKIVTLYLSAMNIRKIPVAGAMLILMHSGIASIIFSLTLIMVRITNRIPSRRIITSPAW